MANCETFNLMSEKASGSCCYVKIARSMRTDLTPPNEGTYIYRCKRFTKSKFQNYIQFLHSINRLVIIGKGSLTLNLSTWLQNRRRYLVQVNKKCWIMLENPLSLSLVACLNISQL